MSKVTDFLKLFKWDLESKSDLENSFNIDKALNENWDKIDLKTKELNDNKVDKQEGYGLSEEDFSTILKEKLEKLKNYDDTVLKQIIDGSIKDITLDPTNGHIIFYKNDGTTDFIDTALELIIQNGTYNKETKKIILTLANKDVIEIPLLDLLTDLYSKSEIDEILSNYEEKHNCYSMIIKEPIEDNIELEIPCQYVVGNDSLVIYHNGDRLICEKLEEDIANYKEVGEVGTVSNKIIFGWNLRVGDVLDFIVKGVVANEENEN